MAKISARGATELARFRNPEGTTERLLRSDRNVLVRYRIGGRWEGWTIRGKLKPKITLERWIRFYTGAGWIRKDGGGR